jgi:hypothetical protein
MKARPAQARRPLVRRGGIMVLTLAAIDHLYKVLLVSKVWRQTNGEIFLLFLVDGSAIVVVLSGAVNWKHI